MGGNKWEGGTPEVAWDDQVIRDLGDVVRFPSEEKIETKILITKA